MALKLIINSFDQKASLYSTYTGSFYSFIEDILKDYNETIQNTRNLYEDIEIFSIKEEVLKNRVDVTTKGVLKALYHYLSSSTSDGAALNIIKETIESAKIFQSNTRKIITATPFIRLRNNPSGKSYTQKDLFHIPFENRNLISTNRYSLSGYPCLYLANSSYVAWEELSRPNDNVSLALFKNNIPLRILDFDTRPFSTRLFADRPSEDEDLLNYAITFPLILASCLPVPNNKKTSNFKEEYIIPQLIMEVVKTEIGIHGVSYTSTRVEAGSNGFFTNYAIPIKEIPLSDSGHCKMLKSWFSMTDIVDYTFTLPYTSTSIYRNDSIENIVINGFNQKFENTQFSLLDYELLQRTDCRRIAF